MRALVAERMVIDPASAAVPRTYCQFGPLHTTLMRPFIALDPLAPRSSRYLSLLAGIAVLFPFLAFARRLVGQRGAELATFMLALSPLHVQASTTAASEALYLLLWVCALERLLDGARLPAPADVRGRRAARVAGRRHALRRVAGAADHGAGGVRVRDARPARDPARPGGVLAVRGVAADRVAGVGRARGRRSAVLRALHHDGPRRAGGGRRRPVRPAARSRAPARDLDARVRRGDDPARGAGRGDRARARAARRRRAEPRRACHRRCGSSSWRRSGRRRFTWRAGCCSRASSRWRASRSSPGRCCCRWPRPRCRPRRRARAGFVVATAAAAVAFSIVVWLVAAVGRDRIWAGAESMGAVTRLDGEDRELARWLRAHRRPHEPVMIEPLAFADIGIAHAAGVPWTEAITLIVTREPRATVADSLRGDGRALPRRLRPRGRNRLAAPPARLGPVREGRANTIRPLACRQSVIARRAVGGKSLTCKLRVVPGL